MGAFQYIRTAFHDRSSSSFRVTEGVIWCLIVISCAFLFLDAALDVNHEKYHWLLWIDRVVLLAFAVEIVLRIATFTPQEISFFKLTGSRRKWMQVRGRVRYALEPINLVDLFTVLSLLPALRGLRAIRLLRLIRTPNWFPYTNPLASFTRAFRDNALLYGFAFSALGLATLLGGVTIFFIERGQPGSDVKTLGDGLWWAIVTLTTVGFGDITPETNLGRIVAGALMIAGMFTLAMFAGIVGHTLLRSVLRIREEQFRMSSYLNHVVICGYNRGARMLLDELRQEYRSGEADLVVFSEDERPVDIPTEFIWVEGDPTKESELPKVRIAHAKAALVVGFRHLAPQAADAITILTVFTLRSYLNRHPDRTTRSKSLYIVAEILEEENVSHARDAGADEVIESTRVGFSLMSHAITMPGTSEIMSRVATSGAHSLYMTPLPSRYDTPLSFRDLAKRFKDDTGALVIGLRDVEADLDRLNPASDFPVRKGLEVLYLAEAPVEPEP